MTVEVKDRTLNSRTFSVACVTCPSEEPARLLVGPEKGFNFEKASIVANAHEKYFGDDHAIKVVGWSMTDLFSLRQDELTDEEKEYRGKIANDLVAVESRVNEYHDTDIHKFLGVSDRWTQIPEYSRVLSIGVNPREQERAPQAVSNLLMRLDIGENERIVSRLRIGNAGYSWGILPSEFTQGRMGAVLSERGFRLAVSFGEGKTDYLGIGRLSSEIPQKARDVLETYHSKSPEVYLNLLSLETAETLIQGADWMMGLIERRRKQPVSVYDHTKDDFIPQRS